MAAIETVINKFFFAFAGTLVALVEAAVVISKL
jgi:hypothetical protein